MFKRVVLVLLAILAIIILLMFGDNYYSRYKSWRDLSSQSISDASQWYLRNRVYSVDEIEGICVYALACSDDRAQLAIVRNLDAYDFDVLRELIWNRRFSDTCQGRTANLGLHFVRTQNNGRNEGSDHAFWSFYNNTFYRMAGHWSGGAFSEEPWERCSMDAATFSVQDGVISKIQK